MQMYIFSVKMDVYKVMLLVQLLFLPPFVEMSPLALLFTFCSIPKQGVGLHFEMHFSPSFSSVYGGGLKDRKLHELHKV